MKINIEVDSDLLVNALSISGIEDKSILVEKALSQFIAMENQRGLKDLWGKVELDDEAYK
jgi:hypothetical protein